MGLKRAFHLGRSATRDVDEEIAFHFASRIEDLVRSGLSTDEARRAAEREFGDMQRVRDEMVLSTRRRAARRSRRESLRDLASDARYVLRSARRSPGVWLTIALTLGLGIGGAATMYGVVDQLLLRGPEGVRDVGSIRRIYAHVRTVSSGEFTTSSLGYVAYTTMRDRTRSVAQAAAYNVNESRIGRGIDAITAQVGAATADFFPLLGVRPARGRFFTAAEDAPPNGAHVLVLSHAYWVRDFGASDSAFGRMITINDRPFTVIGVAPVGFTGAELRPVDMWMPMSAVQAPRDDWPTTWQAQWLNVIVRVKPHVTPTQLDADVTSAFRASYAGTDKEWKVADVTGRDVAFTAGGHERPEAAIARWLSAVALLVLIIAAANAASLLVVRAMRRHHEIAVRLALGIGRMRLARLLMLEGLACAVGGAVAGVALAYVGGETMRRVLLPSIAWATSPVSRRVVLVACVLSLIAGGLIGLAPLAQVFGTDLAMSLRDSVHAGVRSVRLRQTLLMVQTALSVTLLMGAGLFIRSLVNVHQVDLGVEPMRVLVARVGWPRVPGVTADAAAAERVREANVWRELRERMARLPGVDDAALAIGSPFGAGFGENVRVPGRDSLPAAPGGGPYISAVGAGYFSTVGTSIVRGRAFDASDGVRSTRVAIINETMATLVWPDENPLGKCLIIDNNPCSTIVGISRDARRNAIREPASMQYYIPFGQETGFGGTALVVRPHGDGRRFEETLRRAIAATVKDANVVNVSSMQERVDPQIRPWRLGATMFGLFGAVALVVAAIGLYSAIAYSTEQRRHEFGVRLAIGASAGTLVRGVMVEGVRTAAIGLGLGALVAIVAGGRIAPLLFDVRARDPVVFGGVAVVLIIAAAVASMVPAWRAGRTDPVTALRSE